MLTFAGLISSRGDSRNVALLPGVGFAALLPGVGFASLLSGVGFAALLDMPDVLHMLARIYEAKRVPT
jgi:hypothetical protein